MHRVAYLTGRSYRGNVDIDQREPATSDVSVIIGDLI